MTNCEDKTNQKEQSGSLVENKGLPDPEEIRPMPAVKPAKEDNEN